MSLNILNSKKKSSRKAKILPQFSISSENKPLLDLLEIQRKSFFDFLQHGIPHELAKIAVFRETAKNSTCKQELELKFNPETYKFISPNFTPKEAILNGKTYACKVYVQATLMIRSPYDIQKTNLFSVVTQLTPCQAQGLRKEKMKQKLNFHPSFNDKNKRLNASKLLHNTYTKWLQSPFVYHSSSLTLSPPTCAAYPEGVKLLTSNLSKGSETEKQRFYSLPSTTDSLALQALQGKGVKVGTSQLLQIFEPTHTFGRPLGYPYKSSLCMEYSKSKAWASSAVAKVNLPAGVNPRYPCTNSNGALDLRFVRSDAYLSSFPSNAVLVSEGVKLQHVQLYKPKYGVWGISSWGLTQLTPYPFGVRKAQGLRSGNVRRWGFTELHIRFAKAHLRQCWLPLSKTLLSKKVHKGLFANSLTPSLFRTRRRAGSVPLKGIPFTLAGYEYASQLRKKKDYSSTPYKSQTLRYLNPLQVQIEDLSEDLYGNEQRSCCVNEMCGLATCKGLEATQNIQIFRPWIFLGELPLMTKRGHFILNGSPRVIVNQIARCPGIYFHEKRRGVGIEQEIRVSADLIPQRGPWLRIQSDWEGRFWARLKQEGRVKYATLYEAFQEFEKEYNPPLICLLSNSYFTTTTSSLFSKSENITFQERKIKEDRQKKALIRLFKNSSRYSLGKLGRSRVNERIHSSFTRSSHAATQAQGGLQNWQGKEEIAQLRGLLPLYPKGVRVECNKLQIRRKPLRNPLQVAKLTPYPFGVRKAQGLRLEDLSEDLYGYPKGVSSANTTTICNSWQSKPNNAISVASGIHSYNSTRNDEKQRNSEGMVLTNCVKELMAKDLDAIHTCLERLLEGQGFTDDIDNLKNRFIRTSGKLLQQQFELGLCRLNEVIMPLLGNLLPDYPRLTKSKNSTTKNIKGNNSALPATNLVEFTYGLKPAYGVKSTRVLSTSNNSNKDETPYKSSYKSQTLRYLNPKGNEMCGLATCKGYIIDSKRECNPRAVTKLNPPAIARVNPFTFTLVSPLFNYASPVRRQLHKTNPSYYKSDKQLSYCAYPFRGKHYKRSVVYPCRVCVGFYKSSSRRIPGGVWGTTTVCNSWQGKNGLLPQQYVQSKERLLPIVRCASQQLKGQKLFTSSLLRILANPFTLTGYGETEGMRRRGKYENFIYLREAEMNNEVIVSTKKPVADGYSKEVSLIKNAPFRWLRTSKPINSAFREFFGSNPLSQYMDQTNPLAEITHKRRLSSMGPGGIKRETAGMEVRGIHPTHYGRVCPIETPEGKNAGLVNSPTVYGRVGNYGFLETPLYQVIENQVQTKRWTFLSAQYEERQNSSLATCDTGLLQFNFLAHVPIPVQTANNPLTHFQQVERHRVGYRALSPIQTISIATALIPFLEHDDANRALMGSNMQRQAIPLLSPERPIVGTGFEPLVVMESGQALQATRLGCVSQADANSIIIHTRYSIEKPLSQNILQNSNLPWSRALVHRFGTRIPYSAAYSFNAYPYPARVKGFPSGVQLVKALRFTMRVGYPFTLTGYGVCTAKNGVVTPYSYKWHTYPLGKRGVTHTHSKYKSKICMGLRLEDLSEDLSAGSSAESFVNKKPISYSHNTFLLRPLKQDLQFYERSNQETCLNQRPLVQEGDWIQKGDFLADSSASRSGDLALGKNVTVAYMPWEGYNFEDAIVISDRLVSDDIYTSVHIERYEIKVSKNSQGKERITNRVPGNSHSLKHLDNFGIARVSSWVQPGDILVGKVVELKRPLSPYERLAWELASRLSPKSPEREKWLNKVWLEDISLRLPPGVCGRVINSQIISTEYASMSDPSLLGIVANPERETEGMRGGGKYKEQTIYPQEVHVYLAVKRKIQIGDKLAGRHGNKGIVSAILPQEDMPYLGDGSCIDMVLNPLGVPSRMNLGQIFECLLGLAGSQLGCNFRITPFDEIAGGEASRSLVFLKLYQCRLMYKQQWLFTPTFPGKSKLFDGRTGEPFENWVTVGQAYMLKLIHMVDHKIHARSTGPYSLFTRQPVRGRSRRGGQRLGEMEVWAVEGFGAAYTLQEFLTIKSDDLKARTALQKGFYKQNDVTFGKIHIAPGNPEAFKVLVSELQALCLHIQM